MTKATELDAKIAANIKAMRTIAKFTQPQVAAHLGIAYQSYQKMEKGGHSFRVSTLDRLAMLYGVGMEAFLSGPEPRFGASGSPLLFKLVLLFSGLSDDDKQKAVESILELKYGTKR